MKRSGYDGKMRQQLMEWGKELETFRLPHWEELPDLELYMDQVRTLVDRYLSPVIQGESIHCLPLLW